MNVVKLGKSGITSPQNAFGALTVQSDDFETAIKIFTEKQKIKNLINLIGLIASAVFCIFCTGTSNIISYISGGIK